MVSDSKIADKILYQVSPQARAYMLYDAAANPKIGAAMKKISIFDRVIKFPVVTNI